LQDEGGRAFREAWVSGVKKYYPGEPKAGYITPWDDIQEWERDSAAVVYSQVHDFITATDGSAARLTRAQKGRFVALCWIGQVYKHFPDPKPSYVADNGSRKQTPISSSISSRKPDPRRVSPPSLIARSRPRHTGAS
jgi:hypothetical protein